MKRTTLAWAALFAWAGIGQAADLTNADPSQPVLNLEVGAEIQPTFTKTFPAKTWVWLDNIATVGTHCKMGILTDSERSFEVNADSHFTVEKVAGDPATLDVQGDYYTATYPSYAGYSAPFKGLFDSECGLVGCRVNMGVLLGLKTSTGLNAAVECVTGIIGDEANFGEPPTVGELAPFFSVKTPKPVIIH